MNLDNFTKERVRKYCREQSSELGTFVLLSTDMEELGGKTKSTLQKKEVKNNGTNI